MTLRRFLAVGFAVFITGCSMTRLPTKPPAVLTQLQAHSLAEKLAATKYGWLIGEPGITRSDPPRLSNGKWFWRWRRGRGQGDMEVIVIFAADGGSPVVDHQFHDSAVYIKP